MFKDTYLSNTWPCEILYQGIKFPSVENFYQAMKLPKSDVEGRRKVATMHPLVAKKYMKTQTVREDWDSIKLEVMEYGLRKKFSPGSPLAYELLKETRELVEYNNWHDNFWGECTCNKKCKAHFVVGQNHLGKLLTKIREELMSTQESPGEEKETYIAGTGSRELRSDNTKFYQVVKHLIDKIKETKKTTPNLTIISGMAEGFDEALARAACNTGTPWIAAIPNKGYRDYYWGRTSLTGENRCEEFKDLITQAREVHYVCDSIYVNGRHSNFHRNEWMVERADKVWVYNPITPGTRQCLAYVKQVGKPYEIIET